MRVGMYQNDSMRVATKQGHVFFDVSGLEWEAGMALDIATILHYVEIRKKEGLIRVFVFDKKSAKKDIDLGSWSDSEVVFAINETIDKNR